MMSRLRWFAYAVTQNRSRLSLLGEVTRLYTRTSRAYGGCTNGSYKGKGNKYSSKYSSYFIRSTVGMKIFVHLFILSYRYKWFEIKLVPKGDLEDKTLIPDCTILFQNFSKC